MVHKLNTSDALKFIFAGKSIFTFVNTITGNRFTFKVKQAKDSNLFFVSVLTGADVYTYIGTLISGKYKHSAKSRISIDAQSTKVFAYVIFNMVNNTLKDFIEIWHEGKCGKCGRTLTVPSSIINGIGPECIKNISKSEKRDKFLTQLLND